MGARGFTISNPSASICHAHRFAFAPPQQKNVRIARKESTPETLPPSVRSVARARYRTNKNPAALSAQSVNMQQSKGARSVRKAMSHLLKVQKAVNIARQEKGQPPLRLKNLPPRRP